VLGPALLTGAASMPAGTLCLTYDDGPGATAAADGSGPRTLPLARYLADEGIRTTFFMVGRDVEALADVPQAVRSLGHLVGNHSWSHPDLVALLAADPSALVPQLADTAEVIGSAESGPTYVRPPYGSWSPAVADALDAGWTSPGLVGPVGWDIDGSDWALWQRGAAAHEAAEHYLRAVESVGRGIVLMHDSTADDNAIRDANRTYEMTRILVPQLRASGYRFVGLDEVTLH